MSIYDKASLVLIPSGSKTSKVYSQKPVSGDGDFTFSRSTAATRVNADGVIEKETQNLFTYSNTFSDSSWYKVNTSVTGGQSGYDGSSDAWLLSKSAASAQVYKDVASNVSTYSIYAKAGTLGGIRLVISTTSTYDSADFDLTNGVLGAVGSVIDASIEDVGGGWYRCSIAGGQVPITRLRMYPATSAGSISDASGNIYIQDAQLEQGLVARDYIETTTTAVEGGITDNVPRLDYTDSSCPALLLEPQRTNLITQSEYGAGASLSNMTATSNAATSPEGVSNATTFETSITGQCQVYQFFTASTGNHTGSVFLKKVDFDWVYMEVGGAVAWFNIGSGTLGNGSAYGSNWTYVDHSIEDYGNGWYRCTLTGNCVSAGSYTFRSLQPVSNNGGYFSNLAGGDTHWFGTQLEEGTYPTSYIPTYGSAVTRNLDESVVTSATDLIGQTEGTMYVEYTSNAKGDGERAFAIGSGGSTNRISIFLAVDKIRIYSTAYGVLQIDLLTNIDFRGNHKVAIKYGNNIFSIFIDGSLIGTYTSYDVPALSKIFVGSSEVYGTSLGGGIHNAMLFQTLLTDQEAIDLTTL